jgi:hypothetical protein
MQPFMSIAAAVAARQKAYRQSHLSQHCTLPKRSQHCMRVHQHQKQYDSAWFTVRGGLQPRHHQNERTLALAKRYPDIGKDADLSYSGCVGLLAFELSPGLALLLLALQQPALNATTSTDFVYSQRFHATNVYTLFAVRCRLSHCTKRGGAHCFA